LAQPVKLFWPSFLTPISWISYGLAGFTQTSFGFVSGNSGRLETTYCTVNKRLAQFLPWVRLEKIGPANFASPTRKPRQHPFKEQSLAQFANSRRACHLSLSYAT
jgi:hypothetical protein